MSFYIKRKILAKKESGFKTFLNKNQSSPLIDNSLQTFLYQKGEALSCRNKKYMSDQKEPIIDINLIPI